MDYRTSHRRLQDRFDTRRLADRLSETAADDLTPFRAFIEARDMFFIATSDVDGHPQCSYKGGDPGFVRVVDEHTLAFPMYDGNGMFLTTGNISENPPVGLLFIDFDDGSRLRVNGTASIDGPEASADAFPGALFIVKVRADAVFPNCRRYVHSRNGRCSCPGATRHPRSPIGNGIRGSTARCRPTTPPTTPTDRARHPSHASEDMPAASASSAPQGRRRSIDGVRAPDARARPPNVAPPAPARR